MCPLHFEIQERYVHHCIKDQIQIQCCKKPFAKSKKSHICVIINAMFRFLKFELPLSWSL